MSRPQRLTAILIIFCWLLGNLFTEPAWAFSLKKKTPEYSFGYEVRGLCGDAQKNVEARLHALQIEIGVTCNRPFVEKQFADTPTEIRKALEPYGYYYPCIDKTLFQDADAHWRATYQIDPGPQLQITNIYVTVTGAGKDNTAIQNLIRHFPLQAGQPLLTEEYNSAKQLLFTTATDQGYLKAQLLKHEILIDLHHYTANIYLHLETGPRYYFGPVSFNQTPFATSFLQRYVQFKPGQPYSAKEALALQDALTSSNYFQRVAVVSQTQQANDYQVPVFVNLTARKPQQYTSGLGYGTDTGPRATLGWELRRVTDTGQRFATLARLSSVQSSMIALYTIPGKNPTKDQYVLNAGVITNDLKPGRATTEQVGASYIHTWHSWQQTYGINYQITQSKLNDEPSQTTNFLIPNISWLRVQTDNQLQPTRGNRINVSMQGAAQKALSDTSFAQGEIQSKWLFPPTENSRILLRGDIGAMAATDVSILPLTIQFLAGGTQSIRGYDYQSIGPGRYLLVGSAEYRYRLYKEIFGAVFYDAGNASDHMGDSFKQGTGVGLVWQSPIGTLELTFAKALSLTGEPVKIQFSMGADL